ncbi:MAG: hypothetical protein N3D79_01825 [Acidilobaceae archaeon]|nr:hypothetical protein [Acidilobaceae archaeon]
MNVEVILIGLSTLESIPLYHLFPGGSAARVVARPARTMQCRESKREICEWMRGPEAFSPISLPAETIVNLSKRWRADVLFLDGFEPWEHGRALREAARDLTVATRAHGFSRPEADYVLLEDVSWLVGENLRKEVISTAEHLHSSGVPFELLVHLPEAREEALGELLEVAEKARALHVSLDPKGGGERALYERLRRKLPFVYLHADLFSELDTYCPQCSTIVLARDDRSLRGSYVEGRACKRCGRELPLFGTARERSSRTLLRLAREGVAWYNPLVFLTFKGLRG